MDAAFEGAHKVSTLELLNNRMVTNPMEPRAAIAEYNSGTEEITLHLTTQNPHVHRLVLSAFNQLAPEHKLRVVGPDVGGGFGAKIFIYAEELVVGWACRKVNRPVKWTADRTEAFLSDAHGRDHVSTAEMAIDENGKFLALRVYTKANLGAYLSTFSTMVPSYLYAFFTRRPVHHTAHLFRSESGFHKHFSSRCQSRSWQTGSDFLAGAPGRCLCH